MSFIDLLKMIGPAVLSTVPNGQMYVPLIMSGILLAEQSKVKGADKKKIALEAVRLGVNGANTIARKHGKINDIINVDQAMALAVSSIDTIISVTKSVDNIKINEVHSTSTAILSPAHLASDKPNEKTAAQILQSIQLK